MSVFFTGDTHFGDSRALRADRRPWPDMAAHDTGLVALWNEVVAPDDEVWHLGDFALGPGPERIGELLAGLNGTKHLIVGNNDGPATLDQAGWASVQHYREIELDGRMVVMCHYAFRTWNGTGRGAVNIHGHSHGRLSPITRQYDVGVDAQAYRPVRLSDIMGKRRKKRPGFGQAG